MHCYFRSQPVIGLFCKVARHHSHHSLANRVSVWKSSHHSHTTFSSSGNIHPFYIISFCSYTTTRNITAKHYHKLFVTHTLLSTFSLINYHPYIISIFAWSSLSFNFSLLNIHHFPYIKRTVFEGFLLTQ